MKELITYQIDSFTKEKFKGNPAGVVLNADGLSDEQMQLIARELNNSETAFLFSPDTSDCDGIIRYFTPKIEVPICGHATIGAMYAKALEENLSSCILNYKTKVGVLPFEILKGNNDYQVIMTQGRFEINPEFDLSTKELLLSALKITELELDENCPIQIASTGHSKVMVGLKSREVLNSLQPDFQELIQLSKQINCKGYYVFTFDSDNENTLTYGRMFAPAVGINEDPVTGNANGPLGGYLVHHKLVNFENDSFEFNAAQGEAINRLGIVNVKVQIRDNLPSLIQIKGEGVVVFRTILTI